MTPDVLTVPEVSEFLRVSRETVYRLAQRGELRGRKIGRVWRFARDDVLDFLSGDRRTQEVAGRASPAALDPFGLSDTRSESPTRGN